MRTSLSFRFLKTFPNRTSYNLARTYSTLAKKGDTDLKVPSKSDVPRLKGADLIEDETIFTKLAKWLQPYTTLNLQVGRHAFTPLDYRKGPASITHQPYAKNFPLKHEYLGDISYVTRKTRILADAGLSPTDLVGERTPSDPTVDIANSHNYASNKIDWQAFASPIAVMVEMRDDETVDNPHEKYDEYCTPSGKNVSIIH
eukprot:TRINITY_DN737_c0_g1_i1.p1 TRINITY_DN737_c0_g1~~TRINITY_DN737_c0_g1_i1.p1  ORF type:complete len:200 (-),score=23.34 TRINITY_DN737_c0_g1_i1:4-603(-)